MSCTITRPMEIYQNWTVPQTYTEDDHPILRKEVEAEVQPMKKGKSAWVDNTPVELVQVSGEDIITALTTICIKIWQTGGWPTPWTQSLVITFPKKGNLQQCQNYRTIGLISHLSKGMLKIVLNRLKQQADSYGNLQNKIWRTCIDDERCRLRWAEAEILTWTLEPGSNHRLATRRIWWSDPKLVGPLLWQEGLELSVWMLVDSLDWSAVGDEYKLFVTLCVIAARVFCDTPLPSTRQWNWNCNDWIDSASLALDLERRWMWNAGECNRFINHDSFVSVCFVQLKLLANVINT